jgi:hypothetical protein
LFSFFPHKKVPHLFFNKKNMASKSTIFLPLIPALIILAGLSEAANAFSIFQGTWARESFQMIESFSDGLSVMRGRLEPPLLKNCNSKNFGADVKMLT